MTGSSAPGADAVAVSDSGVEVAAAGVSVAGLAVAAAPSGVGVKPVGASDVAVAAMAVSVAAMVVAVAAIDVSVAAMVVAVAATAVSVAAMAVAVAGMGVSVGGVGVKPADAGETCQASDTTNTATSMPIALGTIRLGDKGNLLRFTLIKALRDPITVYGAVNKTVKRMVEIGHASLRTALGVARVPPGLGRVKGQATGLPSTACFRPRM